MEVQPSGVGLERAEKKGPRVVELRILAVVSDDAEPTDKGQVSLRLGSMLVPVMAVRRRKRSRTGIRKTKAGRRGAPVVVATTLEELPRAVAG
ncbi:MAG: hypothetical protein AB1416_01270 [Actinomycetota bacterium]